MQERTNSSETLARNRSRDQPLSPQRPAIRCHRPRRWESSECRAICEHPAGRSILFSCRDLHEWVLMHAERPGSTENRSDACTNERARCTNARVRYALSGQDAPATEERRQHVPSFRLPRARATPGACDRLSGHGGRLCMDKRRDTHLDAPQWGVCVDVPAPGSRFHWMAWSGTSHGLFLPGRSCLTFSVLSLAIHW